MSKNKKNKGGCKLNMKMIFMLTIIVTMAVSLVTLNSIVVPSSKNAITEEVLNNLKTAVEGQSMLIDEYITSNELIMREYGASNAVRELLSDPDNAQKQKAAQEFTERYFSNLENWEGIYTSNWDTTVLAHSTAAVVGMTTREGDALPPYQASMSEAPDGFFNGGVFTSPASGQMILNMRQGIQDANGNWVGLVGGDAAEGGVVLEDAVLSLGQGGVVDVDAGVLAVAGEDVAERVILGVGEGDDRAAYAEAVVVGEVFA